PMDEVERYTGITAEVETRDFGCYGLRYIPAALPGLTMYFSRDDHHLAYVYAASPGVFTTEGIQVGSSEADLLAAVPGLESSNDGQTWTYLQFSPEHHDALVYWVIGHTVREIGLGEGIDSLNHPIVCDNTPEHPETPIPGPVTP